MLCTLAKKRSFGIITYNFKKLQSTIFSQILNLKNWIRQYMGKMIDSFPHEKDQTLLIIISLVERECL